MKKPYETYCKNTLTKKGWPFHQLRPPKKGELVAVFHPGTIFEYILYRWVDRDTNIHYSWYLFGSSPEGEQKGPPPNKGGFDVVQPRRRSRKK